MKFAHNIVLKAIFSLLIFFLVFCYLNPLAFSSGILEFDVGMKVPRQGQTVIHISPLGVVKAPTHSFPVELHLYLKKINFEELERTSSTYSLHELGSWQNFIFKEIKIVLFKYISLKFLLAFLLGIATSLLWPRNSLNRKEMLLLGFLNTFFLLLFFSAAFITYDNRAFSKAEYEGVVEATPLVLNFLEEGKEFVNNLRHQLVEVTGNIHILQGELEKNKPFLNEKEILRVLHVSDIHNNPAAFDFVEYVVKNYQIDMIIDTGDLVDIGTAMEVEAVSEFISKLKVSYVFIPGNHESPQAISRLKEVKNVTVLEKGVTELQGLSIAGIADPSAYSYSMEVPEENVKEDTAKELMNLVNSHGEIDIIAAHNPDVFKYLRRDNNLLLGGHMHAPYVIKNEDYIEINAGTTGASGIRGLKNMEMNFSMILLNFQPSGKNKTFEPLSADIIKIKLSPLYFSFERIFLKNK